MKAPLTRFALLFVFLLAVSYAFVAFPKGIHAWQEKQRQIQEKEKSNTILVKEVERQKERVHRLATDPAEQELEIRKRLKLARPDEKVFITGEPEQAAEPQPARK
jgi:cell division protein FtsB